MDDLQVMQYQQRLEYPYSDEPKASKGGVKDLFLGDLMEVSYQRLMLHQHLDDPYTLSRDTLPEEDKRYIGYIPAQMHSHNKRKASA